MSAEKKSEVWDLVVIGTHRYRTCFSEPVTLEEAKELFRNDEFEDVIDTEELEVTVTRGDPL